MNTTPFPVIDLAATGRNIQRLREKRGLTVRDLQAYFGFEEPQAIYKWQKGKSLPTVDNLYALAALLHVTVDDILVPLKLHILPREQQAEPRCSPPFFWEFSIAQIKSLRKGVNPAYQTGCRLSLNWWLNGFCG